MTRLREERLARGWTQHQLAVRSGVHKDTISRIELGHVRHPWYPTMCNLLKAFGIPWSDRGRVFP